MERSQILVRHPEVVEAEVDGQRVLLSPADFSYFGLVDTGALVWDRLDGVMPLGDLIATLAREFEIGEVTVERDVEDFLSALKSAGLVTLA